MIAKKLLKILIGTIIILLVPVLAMQFTDSVQWDLRDFVIIGTLLFSAGTLYELITSRIDPKYRNLVAIILLAVVLLIWGELAVGIVGSPIAGS